MGHCDLARFKELQQMLEEEYEFVKQANTAARLNTCAICGREDCPSLRFNEILGRHPLCPQDRSCRLPNNSK